MRARWWAWLALAGSLGCGGGRDATRALPARGPRAPEPPTPSATTASAASDAPTAGGGGANAIGTSTSPTATSASRTSATATSDGAPTPVGHAKLERVVEGPVVAFAVEKAPHWAALGEREAWVERGHGIERHALPDAATRAPAPDFSLFYGRDTRIRVVGNRGSAGTSVYLRLLDQGFVTEKKELGRLGDLEGGLVAVLGTADPEIVCRPGDACLVKSVRGWDTVPAPAGIERVTLGEGVGWAIAGRGVLRLGKKGWDGAGSGSFAHADGLFALHDAVWIVEHDTDRLHVVEAGAETVSRAPLRGPRCLWGTRRDDLWLVGDEGLAHFDGRRWIAATDVRDLRVVGGRGPGEVWVGGLSGLYRVGGPPTAE